MYAKEEIKNTEGQQTYTFDNEWLKKDIGRVFTENLDGYEFEKLNYLTTEINNKVEVLNLIKEYIKQADELWIEVKKDFDFVSLYKEYFDRTMSKKLVDRKEFSEKLDKYAEDLKNAIKTYNIKYYENTDTIGQTEEDKQTFIFKNWELTEDIDRTLTENVDEYESEKLEYITIELNSKVKKLNIIKEHIKQADKLWIEVQKDFTFDYMYNTYFNTTICENQLDRRDFNKKLDKYAEDLENAIGTYYFKYHNWML